LPLKSSHNAERVQKQINANQIHSEMHQHPVYGNKRLTKPTVHVWCKKILNKQKFASQATEMQSVVFKWLEQQPSSFFASGIQMFVDI